MKKRLDLNALEVKSFITTDNKEVALGGSLFPTACACNTLQCSEAYTICCAPTETQIPDCR